MRACLYVHVVLCDAFVVPIVMGLVSVCGHDLDVACGLDVFIVTSLVSSHVLGLHMHTLEKDAGCQDLSDGCVPAG